MIKKIVYNGEVSYIPLPRPFREALGMSKYVEMKFQNNSIIITNVSQKKINASLKKVK